MPDMSRSETIDIAVMTISSCLATGRAFTTCTVTAAGVHTESMSAGANRHTLEAEQERRLRDELIEHGVLTWERTLELISQAG